MNPVISKWNPLPGTRALVFTKIDRTKTGLNAFGDGPWLSYPRSIQSLLPGSLALEMQPFGQVRILIMSDTGEWSPVSKTHMFGGDSREWEPIFQEAEYHLSIHKPPQDHQ